MHCKHCWCWVVAVLMPLASKWSRGIPLCSTVGCGSHPWSHMEIKCSNCLLQRWNCFRMSFSNPEWYAEGLGVLSWLRVDSRALMILSPAKQRFEPWPPESCVGTVVSSHHNLKASLAHSTNLKKHLDLVLVKLKCWGFSTLGEKNLPCFFQLYHLSCYHCISFTIFYPLTITPLALPPKNPQKYITNCSSKHKTTELM